MNTTFLERNPGLKYVTTTRDLPINSFIGSKRELEIVDTLTSARGAEYAQRKRKVSEHERKDGTIKRYTHSYCRFDLGEAQLAIDMGGSNHAMVYLKVLQGKTIPEFGINYDEETVRVEINYVQREGRINLPEVPNLKVGFPEASSLGVNLKVDIHNSGGLTLLSLLPPFKNGFLSKQMLEWRRGKLSGLYRDRDWLVDDYYDAKFAFRVDETDGEEAKVAVDDPETELYKLTIPKFMVVPGFGGNDKNMDFEMTFPVELGAKLRQRILNDGEDWLELFEEPPVRMRIKSSEPQDQVDLNLDS